MASASTRILRNIDEKFCQCCVCFEQYEDPRQLDCLHRFCRKCLQQMVDRSDGTVKCPLCQTEFKVPQNGAEGFKKDFFMNEILEFIQVQNSLEQEQVRKCFGCSDEGILVAYCFKCGDYLCQKCYEYHVTSKVLEEHRQHVITLKDFDQQEMTMEKMISLKETPRCQIHEETLCQLFCKTCSNSPICVMCTYGEHRDHDIYDVISFAKSETEKLTEHLNRVKKCKEDLSRKSNDIDRAKQEMTLDADEKLQQVKTKYEEEIEKVKKEKEKILDEYQLAEREISEKLTNKLLIRKKELEEKINQLKSEFMKLEEKDKFEKESSLKKLKEEKKLQESKLQHTQEKISKKWKDFYRLFEAEKDNYLKNSNEISDNIQSKIKRCENTVETGSGVLLSHSNWTIAKNASEIYAAAESLIEDTRKESEMKILSWSFQTNVTFNDPIQVKLSKTAEKVYEVEAIRAKGTEISGITCTRSGVIVLTGPIGGHKYHITLLSQNGEVIYQTQISCSIGPFSLPESYCAAFQESKVVLVCDPDWMGIFDLTDYSVHGKTMNEFFDGPTVQGVRSVSVDEQSDNIVVGSGDRGIVHIFNAKLELRRKLELGKTLWLMDVFINNGYILVCDGKASKINVFNVNNSEHTNTILPPNKRFPYPVCIRRDANGFIYVMWRGTVPVRQTAYAIAQYSRDMVLLRTQQIISADIRCFTSAHFESGEKLLVASEKTGKIYQYGLTPDYGEDD